MLELSYVQEQIIKTTLQVLKKKEISQITISEIVYLAEVSRSSFYRNFKTIEDILSLEINRIISEYYDKLILESPHDERRSILLLVTIFKKYSDFFVLLYKRGMYLLILEKIHDFISYTAGEDSNKFKNAFLSYGLFGCLLCYFDGGMKENPEEFLNIYESYAQK